MLRPEKNEVDVYLEKLYDDYKDNPERVFDSIKEKIEPLSNDGEFIELCESYKGSYHAEFERYRKAPPEQQEAMEGYLNLLKMLSEPSFDSFCAYLENVVMAYMLIIYRFQLDITKAHQIVEKKAREFYPESKPESISVSGKKPENIRYPLDKVTHTLFRNLQKGEYALSAEKSGSDREITTVLTIDFDELKQDTALTFRELTPFDQRIYISAESLLEAGNEYISATQIYKAMGGKGRPAPNQIENIINSCTGMMATRIKIDNHEEAEAYNYPEYQRGIFYLFPVEIAENVKINGKTTDFCLHFLKKELPLFEYSRSRKQVTQFTPEQWALPFSMTEDNISLDSYFRTRISRMKHDKKHSKTGKYNGKMLYDTIYEKCGIDTRKKRFDTTKKFRQLLDHYVKTGIISAYKEETDGLKIIL